MKVHVTFRTSSDGGRTVESITLKKDGGFEPAEVGKLTEALASFGKITHVSEEELDETDEEREVRQAAERDAGMTGEGGSKSAGKGGEAPLGDKTPPAGRGRVALKTPEGTGFKKSGEVDRRTLRGTPEQPDPSQQKFVERVEKQAEQAAHPQQ